MQFRTSPQVSKGPRSKIKHESPNSETPIRKHALNRYIKTGDTTEHQESQGNNNNSPSET